MIFYTRGNYCSKGERVGKNGKTYYSVAILQGTEPISLGCSADVYTALAEVESMEEITLRFTENVMNGKNGSFISRYCVGLGDS